MNEVASDNQQNKEVIQRLKSFSDIVLRLASEHDIEKLISLILSEIRKFTNADAGSLYIKEGNLLIFKVTQNDTLEANCRSREEFLKKFKTFTLPINEKSLAGLAATRKLTFSIPDVQASPYHNPDMDRKFGYRLSSMLVVPMINHNGDLVGVLQLMNAIAEGGFVPFNEKLIPQVEALANQAAVLFDNLRLYDELDKLFDALVRYSTKAIDARDPCTAGHSGRVAQYAVDVAKHLGSFSAEEIKELRYASLFHDIGKIGVREDVLTKENKLSSQQMETIRERFNAIKQHFINLSLKQNWPKDKLEQIMKEVDDDLAIIEKYNAPCYMSPEALDSVKKVYRKTFISYDGKPRKYLLPHEYDNLCITRGNLNTMERINIESHAYKSFEILSQIPFPPQIAKIPELACKHHEKLDGSGYPAGCKADEIPIQARILAVVDVYDALVAEDRPYKKPMSKEKAFSILDAEVEANHFDATVVIALKEVIALREQQREKILSKRTVNQ